MVLQNYSGDKLRVVRQIKVQLARSGFIIEAVIQVQKGAPEKLLIGTDILPQLGYLFIQSTMDGKDVNLLGSECHPSSSKQESASKIQCGVSGNYGKSTEVALESNCGQAMNKDNCYSNSSKVVGTVHLIQATKLPARHKKMVKTQVAGVSHENYNLVLFEPNMGELEEK